MEFDENGYVIEPEEKEQEYSSSQFLMLTYDILTDERLTDFERILYSAITGLCRKEGYCWASNAYIAKMLNKSEGRVKDSITKLVNLGYLKRELVYKKKKEKNGDIITTKQISFRKLFVVINNGGGDINNIRGGDINNHLLNNNLINNPSISNLSKDKLTNSATEAQDGKDEINNNTNMGNEVVLEENVFEKDFLEPAAPVEEKPKKRKQGVNLAPYIDAIKEYYIAYKDISNALTNYVIQVNRQRAVWTLEEWHEVLDYLYNSTSISIPGTKGRKVMVNQVLEKIEFALKGNGTTPYMDFKNEPPSANKENFVPSFIKKGY